MLLHLTELQNADEVRYFFRYCPIAQKIIPMPESLNIESGSRTKTAIKLYQAANRSGIEEESYAECGERLKEVLQKYDKKLAERIGDFDLEGTLQFGKTAVNNLIRYGAATWYEWCIEHWGTKWNGYDLGEGYPCEKNQLRFYTAWDAPHPVLQELSAVYPLLAGMPAVYFLSFLHKDVFLAPPPALQSHLPFQSFLSAIHLFTGDLSPLPYPVLLHHFLKKV